MNQIDLRIAELSPAKRALLEKKLQQKVAISQPEPTILRLVNREAVPLSFAQSRLWFLDRLEPGNPVYNRTVKIDLTGKIDQTLLEQSLNEIVKRHEILRTSFPAVGSEPIQAIAPHLSLNLLLVDLSDLPEIEREVKVKELASTEARQAFDLTQLPLLRATLIKLGSGNHILLLTSHHIIFDGWSDNVFMQELGAIYTALASGTSSTLPELPIQYADFTQWQKTWLSGKVWDDRLNYWKEQLAGNPPALQLPTDRDRSVVQDSKGDRQHFKLSSELSQSIKSLCQREKTTLFIALLTAFNVLLNRYTKQEDIIICSPVAGRNRMEVEKLIGYFNNLLPLRTDLSGNPSFKELLLRVRQVVVGTYEHQDIPFQNIAELPNLVRTPLAIGMFALQNSPTESLKIPGISISSANVDNETANFDISWSMQEMGDAIEGTIEYRTGLFDTATIGQMVENFQILLQNIVDNPKQLISSLPSFEGVKIHAEESVPFVAPNNEWERKLAQIWENLLEIQPIGIKENFFALGGHSLLAVRLFAAIEQEFGKNLPMATLFEAPTIEQLAKFISPAQNSTRNSLVTIKSGNSQPPLFLLHDADGETILYRNLAFALTSDRAVYGIQPYGKDGFPILHTRISDMVNHYIETIRTVQPTGPYLLGGLCVGGILAFEVALQLQARGEKVAFVGLIDAIDVQAPKIAGKIKARRLDSLSQVLQANEQAKLSERANYIVKALARKTKSAIAYELGLRLKRQQNRVKIRLLRYYLDKGLPLPTFLQNISTRTVYQFAEREYTPSGIYKGKIGLFRATEGEGSEEPAIHRTNAPLFGWDKRVTRQIQVYDIAGNHSSMLREPNVRLMGAKMERDIEIALSNCTEEPTLLQTG